LDKRTNAAMLGVICAVLLTVTVFGIVGLTEFWVTRRRRCIGMRRALGARRIEILKYFPGCRRPSRRAACDCGVLRAG
jgi:putative ABC transport system permease protein